MIEPGVSWRWLCSAEREIIRARHKSGVRFMLAISAPPANPRMVAGTLSTFDDGA